MWYVRECVRLHVNFCALLPLTTRRVCVYVHRSLQYCIVCIALCNVVARLLVLRCSHSDTTWLFKLIFGNYFIRMYNKKLMTRMLRYTLFISLTLRDTKYNITNNYIYKQNYLKYYITLYLIMMRRTISTVNKNCRFYF